MPTDTILSYVITGSLGLLLTIVGTKITYHDLKDTITNKKKQISLITTHNYLFSPALAIIISNTFNLDFPRSIALFVFSVVPSSPSASSVFTMLTKGDVPLAMTASVISMVSSFILMPSAFWLQLKLYKNNNDVTSIQLPYLQIVGILTFFTCAISFGMVLKRKLSRNYLDLYKKYTKRAMFLSIIAIIILFSMTTQLVHSAFYHGPDWIIHYTSIISFIIINPTATIITTRVFCINDTAERDAIFFTVLRKNPAIPMAVASLSFKNTVSDEDYYTIVGIEFILPFIMDLISNPIFLYIRKKRVGYFCCKNNEESQLHEELQQEVKEANQENQDVIEENQANTLYV